MVENNPKVIWDNEAKKQLREAYNYIRRESPQNADKVRADIVELTKRLAKNPEANRLDKYRLNNDGNFRAFEIHRYRISYPVSQEQITIVRVRHTSREPQAY